MLPQVFSCKVPIAQKNDEGQKDFNRQERESIGKFLVVCKCPRCEKEHRTFLRWTGRGTPRVYCPTCRSTTSAIGETATGKLANVLAKSARKTVDALQ